MDRDRTNEPHHHRSYRDSFLSKPQHGWLHPDAQLASDVGVCYPVRYVGNLEILESMKSLDVDTRTDMTKECIRRICCAAGLKPPSKMSTKNQKINRCLAAEPDLTYAVTDINLTITAESMTLVGMDGANLLYHHLMPTISFASGGDVDTIDFVAYVTKDDSGRTCHVMECGGGLVQDVISTIGQAFELRFKSLLTEASSPTAVHERVPTPVDDYYNDRPGAIPPSPQQVLPPPARSNGPAQTESPHYQFSRANEQVFGDVVPTSFNVSRDSQTGDQTSPLSKFHDGEPTGNYCTPHTAVGMGNRMQDPFDMRPFKNVLQNGNQPAVVPISVLPYNEPWFHGKISRKKCEEFLRHNGDFLVRESPNSPGQFVLSGRHAGHIRHLLLVDPEGKVRTKDQLFSSVGHLVNYHMLNNVPIISVDSELSLLTPVVVRSTE